MEQEKLYQNGFKDGLYATYKSCKEPNISTGTAAILVCDKDIIGKINNSFEKWLIENGFTLSSKSKGFYGGVYWIYVNLNSKQYSRGMLGVGVTAPFGNHAVTIAEFKIIFNIYNKYENLKPLQF